MFSSTDASGKRKTSFSFYRAAVNMFPNFASDAAPESVSKQLDVIFDFQTSLKPPQKPQELVPVALYLSGITQDEKSAGKVHAKLLKMGILLPQAPWVDTHKIDSGFPNQFAILPVYAQKTLVSILFDWEEEVKRWKMLEEEEEEILIVMGEVKAINGDVGHLEKRLLEIKGLKALKPTMREARSAEGPPPAHELPGYEGPPAGS